jgi:hypothetical protein
MECQEKKSPYFKDVLARSHPYRGNSFTLPSDFKNLTIMPDLLFGVDDREADFGGHISRNSGLHGKRHPGIILEGEMYRTSDGRMKDLGFSEGSRLWLYSDE